MKKAVWLVAGLLCVVVGVTAFKNKETAVLVKTETMYAKTIQETVECKGKVEKSVQTQVTLPTDVVVDEVYVDKGDVVKKGEVLFTIDTASTLQSWADADGAAAVQAAMSGTIQETVTAPCDGRVSMVGVMEGAVLEKGRVATELDADTAVCIRLSVPERHIRSVQEGQNVVVTGEGFYKSAYTGTVTEIATVAKQVQNGTVAETVVEALVTLRADEIDASLRVGLNAKGAVTVSTVSGAFVLPYTAVEQDADDQEYVYVLKDGKAEKRTFVSRLERTDGYVVTEGFTQGDVLILTPNGITEGALLQTEEVPNDRTS